MHPEACSCTPLVFSHNNKLKKRAHNGRTARKNVHPSTEMCAPGAGRTLNFEHCCFTIYTMVGVGRGWGRSCTQVFLVVPGVVTGGGRRAGKWARLVLVGKARGGGGV